MKDYIIKRLERSIQGITELVPCLVNQIKVSNKGSVMDRYLAAKMLREDMEIAIIAMKIICSKLDMEEKR